MPCENATGCQKYDLNHFENERTGLFCGKFLHNIDKFDNTKYNYKDRDGQKEDSWSSLLYENRYFGVLESAPFYFARLTILIPLVFAKSIVFFVPPLSFVK